MMRRIADFNLSSHSDASSTVDIPNSCHGIAGATIKVGTGLNKDITGVPVRLCDRACVLANYFARATGWVKVFQVGDFGVFALDVY